MRFRSSNAKYTHFSGDVLSNVDDSSHGVKLSGGTTGGMVEATGDEDNVALTVRPKGAGPMQVGGSGTITFGTAGGALQLGSSGAITIGASPSAIKLSGSGTIDISSGGGAVNIATSGAITIGSGAGTVNVGSSGGPVFIAGSTVPFLGFTRFTDTAVATPNFATTNAMVMETTHTITGLPAATLGGTTNAYIVAMPHNLSTDCALLHAFVGSTAEQAHCRFAKVSTLAVGATTATISFLVFRV